MKRPALLLAALCVMLAACTPARIANPFVILPFVKSAVCSTAECSVDVKVIENSDGTCLADAAPIIDLRSGPPGQRTITWTLTSDGYQFSDEKYKWGVFIKSDPGDEFRNAQVTANGRRLTLQFDHRATGRQYEYGLTVRRANGSFCTTLDPWLIS